MKKLFIPVILGTSRPGRQSEKVANLIVKTSKEIPNIVTSLIDPLDFHFPYDGNDSENKDPRYTEITDKADGFIIVTPEYNHSFPGTLKRMLDSELKNYIHKPVAIAGVSNGIFGGARAIENLLPTLREMGMIASFSDLYFPEVQNLFDENGNILDTSYVRRIKRTLDELTWLATTLNWGKENIPNIYHKIEK